MANRIGKGFAHDKVDGKKMFGQVLKALVEKPDTSSQILSMFSRVELKVMEMLWAVIVR